MTQQTRSIVLAGIAALLTGCRTATQVTEVPRVDQQLEGGNRGYLVGTPPASADLKPTRQMVSTDIEVPSFYRPKMSRTPVSLDGLAPPETERPEAGANAPGQMAPGTYDTYVVQQGDSLWSIAAKPEIYGRASRWRLLYDANRDQLKGPGKLKAGMTLNIPRGAQAGGEAEGEGMRFKK